MKKVGICGHFGIGKNLLNGQTIKTKIFTKELKRQLGSEQVEIVDTHGGMRHIPRMCIETLKLFINCDNIIIAPAHRGLQLYVPMCFFYKLLFKRRIHYIVIGGWLDSYLKKHILIRKLLRSFTSICVETSTMKNALERCGFKNIDIVPNCKELEILQLEEISDLVSIPYNLCTFSRVMKEKGIEDVIHVINEINECAQETVFTLDIYGEIWKDYEREFITLQKNFPDYIRYMGKVDFDQSSKVLSKYFALVFPTKFYTEGIPGTIIDAYAAGLPVISARWESFSDVIDDQVTGIGYEFANSEELKKVLLKIANDPRIITKKKINCLKKAKNYIPRNVIGKFVQNQLY